LSRKTSTTELVMYPHILTLLGRQGRPHAGLEVRCGRRSIDIVVATPSLGVLTSVEVKARQVAEGVRQAALNQLSVHYSYLAIPVSVADRMTNRTRGALLRLGLGLIAVGPSKAQAILRARRSPLRDPTKSKVLRGMLVSALCRDGGETWDEDWGGAIPGTFLSLRLDT